MRMVWLLGLTLLPASTETNYDEKYQRDYNILNPIDQLRPERSTELHQRHRSEQFVQPY
jgi:hypothetical protein